MTAWILPPLEKYIHMHKCTLIPVTTPRPPPNPIWDPQQSPLLQATGSKGFQAREFHGQIYILEILELEPVAHACNASYLGV
jgi:hypothetical protein